MWLGDLWTGKLSVRRAAVLASQLPLGARVWSVDRRDAERTWTSQDYWMANLIDAVSSNTWVTANRGVKSGDRTELPDPVPRPRELVTLMEARDKMERNARLFRAAYLAEEKASGD